MAKPVKSPGTRRHARELAAQFLYQHDLGGGPVEEALDLFWQTQTDTSDRARKFAEELIRGCMEKRPEIDEKIKK